MVNWVIYVAADKRCLSAVATAAACPWLDLALSLALAWLVVWLGVLPRLLQGSACRLSCVVLAFELPVSCESLTVCSLLSLSLWVPQVNAAKWRWHYLGLLFLLVGLRANAKTTRGGKRVREGEDIATVDWQAGWAALCVCHRRRNAQRDETRQELEQPPALFSAPNNLCRN